MLAEKMVRRSGIDASQVTPSKLGSSGGDDTQSRNRCCKWLLTLACDVKSRDYITSRPDDHRLILLAPAHQNIPRREDTSRTSTITNVIEVFLRDRSIHSKQTALAARHSDLLPTDLTVHIGFAQSEFILPVTFPTLPCKQSPSTV